MRDESEGRIRRVMLVAASNRRRGAEVFTEQLGSGLARRGWSVDAVCLTVASDDALAEIDPLTDVAVGSEGRFNTEIMRALRRRIKGSAPDVVVAMGGSTLRYAAAAKPGTGASLAYFAIGEPRYWLSSRVAVAINRTLYRSADRILAVCDMTKRQLLELDDSLEGRIEVATTGVEDHLFSLEGNQPQPGQLRVLYVGSLSPEKDPLMAVAAVNEIDSVSLRMVGAGPLADSVEQMVSAAGIGDRVELVGPVDDVRPHLAWADVLVLTSKTEGLPGVILEAAAAGVPSVAVDVGGVREAILDGETGVVVPRVVTALSSALASLRDDPEGLDDMGRRARARARSEFHIETAIDRFESILGELVS